MPPPGLSEKMRSILDLWKASRAIRIRAEYYDRRHDAWKNMKTQQQRTFSQIGAVVYSHDSKTRRIKQGGEKYSHRGILCPPKSGLHDAWDILRVIYRERKKLCCTSPTDQIIYRSSTDHDLYRSGQTDLSLICMIYVAHIRGWDPVWSASSAVGHIFAVFDLYYTDPPQHIITPHCPLDSLSRNYLPAHDLANAASALS